MAGGAFGTHMQDPNCIFCQMVTGQAPCHKIWEDAHYLAFLSIYPNTEGITVVIPKLHTSSYLFDQPDGAITDIMLAAKQVASRLLHVFKTASRVGIVFEGYGVNHLHVKLFPLHGTHRVWRPIKSTLTTRYAMYPGYISTHDVERADDTVLAALAKRLRGEG